MRAHICAPAGADGGDYDFLTNHSYKCSDEPYSAEHALLAEPNEIKHQFFKSHSARYVWESVLMIKELVALKRHLPRDVCYFFDLVSILTVCMIVKVTAPGPALYPNWQLGTNSRA